MGFTYPPKLERMYTTRAVEMVIIEQRSILTETIFLRNYILGMWVMHNLIHVMFSFSFFFCLRIFFLLKGNLIDVIILVLNVQNPTLILVKYKYEYRYEGFSDI